MNTQHEPKGRSERRDDPRQVRIVQPVAAPRFACPEPASSASDQQLQLGMRALVSALQCRRPTRA